MDVFITFLCQTSTAWRKPHRLAKLLGLPLCRWKKKPHSRIGAGTSPCTTTLQGQSRGSPFLHLIILKSWDVGRWGESREAGWRPVADGEIPQILPLIPRSRRRNKLHEHPLGQALILPAQPPDCPNCSYPGCACFGLAASFTAPSSNNQY